LQPCRGFAAEAASLEVGSCALLQRRALRGGISWRTESGQAAASSRPLGRQRHLSHHRRRFGLRSLHRRRRRHCRCRCHCHCDRLRQLCPQQPAWTWTRLLHTGPSSSFHQTTWQTAPATGSAHQRSEPTRARIQGQASARRRAAWPQAGWLRGSRASWPRLCCCQCVAVAPAALIRLSWRCLQGCQSGRWGCLCAACPRCGSPWRQCPADWSLRLRSGPRASQFGSCAGALGGAEGRARTGLRSRRLPATRQEKTRLPAMAGVQSRSPRSSPDPLTRAEPAFRAMSLRQSRC